MKITKINKLTEAILREDNETDLEINPQTDSVADIAATVQDSVEAATDDKKSVSAEDAVQLAQEIKDVSKEVDAGSAVIVPKEDSFIIENVLVEVLDDSLAASKKAMRRNEKTGNNVLVSGLPGSGKTAICEEWAKDRGLVWVPMNAADSKVDAAVNGMPLRDMSEKDANKIIYQYSMEKLGALLDPQNAGKCILFVDEFNRQTNQQLRRTFLSMFNEKRNADGKLDFSKNLLFTIVCINPSVKEDAGATRLNQAEMSRFVTILDKFDSDPESSKAYFTATIANSLTKLGVDAQDAIAKIYGVNLKTASSNKIQANKNIEKNENWKEDVEDYIKRLDLAMTILNATEFKFDSEEDLHDIYINAKQLLNQRLLTDSIAKCNGDATKFLRWVDKFSNLLDRDKQMFHEILDNYFVDLPALKKAYGIEDDNNNGEKSSSSESNTAISSGQQTGSVEDDSDLFAAYNQANQTAKTNVVSPTAALDSIKQAILNF